MLKDMRQHRRAVEEVRRLSALVNGGTATESDRLRLAEGNMELLCWEWEHESAPSPSRTSPTSVRAIIRDPRAIRFADWWALNRHNRLGAWFEQFGYWTEPFNLDTEQGLALWEDVSAEIHERQWMEEQGMVVTDFENISDGERRAA